jgi:hypothetical protein
LGFLASCARRLPVRALLCLRFGTAIVFSPPETRREKGGQLCFAGTARTALGTKRACPPFSHLIQLKPQILNYPAHTVNPGKAIIQGGDSYNH